MGYNYLITSSLTAETVCPTWAPREITPRTYPSIFLVKNLILFWTSNFIAFYTKFCVFNFIFELLTLKNGWNLQVPMRKYNTSSNGWKFKMVAVPISQVNLSQFSDSHNFTTQHSYSLKFCRFSLNGNYCYTRFGGNLKWWVSNLKFLFPFYMELPCRVFLTYFLIWDNSVRKIKNTSSDRWQGTKI